MSKLVILLSATTLLVLDGPVDMLEAACLVDQEVRFAAQRLTVRAAPNPQADSVGYFAKRAPIPVLGCAESWCQIETELVRGFVLEARLSRTRPQATNAPAPAPRARSCCKICRKGKACGNSCISRRLTCRKGAGCACNG